MALDPARRVQATARLMAYVAAIGPDEPGAAFPPPLTPAQLARMLELDYRSCARALQDLERRGAIRVLARGAPRYELRPDPAPPPASGSGVFQSLGEGRAPSMPAARTRLVPRHRTES